MSDSRTDTLPEHPFWDFSLQLYSRPGVAAACLALQDGYRIDVNLLLLCCWRGHTASSVLRQSELRRLITDSGDWHDDVVSPLRALRRRLKNTIPNIPETYSAWLRRKIQQIEIDAEHIHQLGLVQHCTEPAGGLPDAAIAADCLRNYFAVIGCAINEKVREHLQIVLAAAFPDMENDVENKAIYTIPDD